MLLLATRQLLLVAGALCFLGLAGCVSPTVRSPEPWIPSASHPVEGLPGVSVAVDPYLSSDRVRAIFGRAGQQSGLLPVRVQIRNAGTTSQILDAAKIRLLRQSDSVSAGRTTGPRKISSGQAALATVTQGFLGIPGLMRARQDEARRLNAILSGNALRSTTLAPGSSTEGFAYFFPNEGTTISGGESTLELTFLETGSSRSTVTVVPLQQGSRSGGGE